MSKRGDSKKESSRQKSRKQATAAKPSTAGRATAAKAQAATKGKRSGGGLLSRAISAVAGALKRRTGKAAKPAVATKSTLTRKNNDGTPKKAARVTRREPDIPMDQIATTYTPTQTSLKAGFRATPDDRSRDQDFAGGVANDRWKDEDRITNKSGDPRIGTHGRTYEPGEAKKKTSSSDDDE